jgi:hypothetical protein
MAKSGEITADASLAQAKKNAAYFRKLLKAMPMGHGISSVRDADYKGHHITIETTYRVKIDGKPFMGALGVSNAGTVHYHGMPNTSFASALDLIRCVIDVFPDEFAKGSGGGMHMGGMGMKTGARRTNVKAKSAARK